MPVEKVSGRALIVWLSAIAVYIVALAGRTSFGVAGVHAIEWFNIDASRLAVFTAVQVGVYAFSQIPIGMLVDRFGARKLLLAGALIMAAGQLILGLTTSYPVAISARVLIGMGDATAFLSIMRLLPMWFPMRMTPVLSQMTGGFGTIGQFISAVPFLHLLNASGWTIAFCSLGAAGILVALAATIFVRDEPDHSTSPDTSPSSRSASDEAQISIFIRLKTVLTDPYCWQGVFTHWTNMGPVMVFLLLWGTPTMSLGLNMSSAEVGLVLTLFSIATVIGGPLSGILSSRLGARRAVFSFWIALLQGTLWLTLFFPNEPYSNPLPIVIGIACAISFISPAANFGFDTVRERLDRSVVTTGTGLSNMGAYLCAMVATQLIGVMLDSHSQGRDYMWEDFRFAWIGLGIVWLAGMIGLGICILIVRRKLLVEKSLLSKRSTAPYGLIDTGDIQTS